MLDGIFNPFSCLCLGLGIYLAQQPATPIAVPPVYVVTEAMAANAPPADSGVTMPSPEPADVYASAEYLLWWLKRSPLPAPLLTTTSDLITVPTAALGESATLVLLGNQNLDTGAHSGARFTAGVWLDDHHDIALEGSYFFLASQTTTRFAAADGSPGSPVLAVPFFDEDAMAENSFVLASPGTAAGAAVLNLTTRLQGAEIQGAVQAWNSQEMHVEVLVGGRYLDLTEKLTYGTTTTGLQDPNTDLVLSTVDNFGTHSQFYGFQLGARGEYRLGGLVLGATAKLALGDMHEQASLSGFASTNFFNAPAGGPFTGVSAQTLPGAGTFVQSSNGGSPFRDVIAAAPELALKAGYQITNNVCVFVGYDFLYLSNVWRPGNQIDRGINFSQTLQSQLAGNAPATGAFPTFNFVGSSFWAQGINLGCELRY